MAGRGKRFVDKGYKNPKPLIEVLGKPIIEWSIKTLGLNGNYIFCCKKEHIENFQLDKKLQELVPNCEIISIDYHTEGTAQTILEATSLIDNNEELIISDSDHYLIWDVFEFNKKIRKRDIDACVMVFPDEKDSTALSYVKLDNDGYVIQASEKIPISKTATVGVHYFKKGLDFVLFAKEMMKKNIRHKNEFYVTPLYNLLAEAKKKVITFPVIKMWALGNPDEVKIFLNEYRENTVKNFKETFDE